MGSTETTLKYLGQHTLTAPIDEDLEEDLQKGVKVNRGTVTIYIRRGEGTGPQHRTRIISINPAPADVPQEEYRAAGCVFDGARTVSLEIDHGTLLHADGLSLTVTRWEGQTKVRPLFEALQTAQNAIVEWLRALGYEVKFG